MLTIIFLKSLIKNLRQNQPKADLKFRLLNSFKEDESGYQSRDQLIEKVYDVKDFDERSIRQRQSIYFALRKLVQRTRRYLEENESDEYDWLSYSHMKNGWYLCRKKVETLTESKEDNIIK